jgi:hypothetical protein
MTGDEGRPVITREDSDRLADALEPWAAERPGINVGELRGALLAALAEHRYAAYSEGIQTGRRIVANVVREALHDEGLL